MKTFNQFLEQIAHIKLTPNQQVTARQLDLSKRKRHSSIVGSTIRSSTSYDKQIKHNISDIEDRRS